MTAEEFYGSGRWQRLRAAILRRDKYQCQMCKRYGKITEAKEVHHIKHFEDYPELAMDPDNLISLCKAHHRQQHPEKTEKMNRGSPRGSRF
jgi:5-methylcytosine-specific restriction endonuclease McrA